jgi:hypothetical protein
MTVRMYPEEQTASASLIFPFDAAEPCAWDVIRTFIADTLPLIDAGGTTLWVLYPGPTVEDPVTFIARLLSLPGGTKEDLQLYLNPTLSLLSDYEIPYGIFPSSSSPSRHFSPTRRRTNNTEFTSETFPTYHASTASAAFNVTEFHVGGLLISRSAVESNMVGFASVIQSLLGSRAAVSSFSVNVSHPVVPPVASNSLTPAWRKAAVSLVIGL